MNYRYPAILAILVVLTAMAVAGCTTSSPTATTTPGGATATPKAATATPTSAPSAVQLFNTGSFNWYEYKMSMAGMDTTTKVAYDTASYGGVSNARHTKTTLTMGEGAQAMVTESDTYFNPTTGALLGGHTKVMMGGSVLSEQDIAPGDANYEKSDYAAQSTTAVPVLVGTESVTVPKGTYTAQKYTVTTGNSTASYWIAAGVPVPIQMVTSAGGQQVTMQLVNYG
jgi:hypothetical protein